MDNSTGGGILGLLEAGEGGVFEVVEVFLGVGVELGMRGVDGFVDGASIDR
jgi:hypothetical protein